MGAYGVWRCYVMGIVRYAAYLSGKKPSSLMCIFNEEQNCKAWLLMPNSSRPLFTCVEASGPLCGKICDRSARAHLKKSLCNCLLDGTIPPTTAPHLNSTNHYIQIPNLIKTLTMLRRIFQHCTLHLHLINQQFLPQSSVKFVLVLLLSGGPYSGFLKLMQIHS